MTDVLIPNLSDEVIADIDERAERLGLSRSEYLRRQVSGDFQKGDRKVAIEDLRRLAELTQDLGNPEIMRKAWG